MEQTKLERLLIAEISGVDDPANEFPGWMVAKSKGVPALLLVLANEMEAFTKAAASKKPYGDVEYADSGLQEDGKKRYPLDTEAHIRAAWSYINQEDNASAYKAADLAKIKAKIKAAMAKLGAETEGTSKASDSDSIVAKIRGLLLGAPTGKDIDMDRDELVGILSENNEALAKAVAEAVSKSVQAPAEGEGKGATEAAAPAEAAATAASEAPTGITEESITKTIQDSLAPYNEILEKVLDRLEGAETALGIAARKSLDGQETAPEGEPVEKSAPDLGDAIKGALARGNR